MAGEMKVLIAASEVIPYSKTGGLADVAGSLVLALRRKGADARVISPLYRAVRAGFKPNDTGISFGIPLGDQEFIGRVWTHDDHALFIECDRFFDRDGLYGTSRGEYPDNALRYVFFSRAVLEVSRVLDIRPDVVHCNDWHTGLVPLYLRTLWRAAFRATASLFTIHNLGYQGRFPASAMTITGLGMEYFTPEGIEFYGDVNMLKAGVLGADAVSTVSPTYAKEVQTAEYGFGMEGVLLRRAADLHGIINGIDYGEWNPASDCHIAAPYDAANRTGKARCKRALAERCGFRKKTAPIVGMIGRLSLQKGVDVFADAVGGILAAGVNIVVLGSGDEGLERRISEMGELYRGRLSAHIGFDDALAHQIYAGADMLMIPSRYEPCGLTQMIAMRYGTVPVARATGGLRDTIEDFDSMRKSGSGFLFEECRASGIVEGVKRALCVYSLPNAWGRLVESCMKRDFSWDASAESYLELYDLLRRKARV